MSLSGVRIDETIKALTGWGDTFFGVHNELNALPAQLVQIAKEAYKEATDHPSLTFLIAALYVLVERVLPEDCFSRRWYS